VKEIAVLSGKGGTGKTSLAASLAALARNKVLADCDVDAADLHLLLNPRTIEKEDFMCGCTARIDPAKCNRCGLCQTICRFEAIHNYCVEPISCEGCAFCEKVCPQQAIDMFENKSGELFVSQTRFGPLVHAKLGIAEENSGKLVAAVRQKAQKMAREQAFDYIIVDGPPGTGCPVISTISGVDLALLVTEPTVSGLHDLKRIMEVCQHFGAPALVCINKYDINEEKSAEIEDFCAGRQVFVAAKIPYDKAFTGALIAGVPLVEYAEGKASVEIQKIWPLIQEKLV